MKTAPATFITKNSLPAIFVEKIKIHPTDADEQLVEVLLSIQTTCSNTPRARKVARNKLLSGNYMIFGALSYSENKTKWMLDNMPNVKACIRSPYKPIAGSIKKKYLKPDKSQRNIEYAPVEGEKDIVVLKKPLAFVHKCRRKELAASGGNLSAYFVVYATDPQSISKSGVTRPLKAMKLGDPCTEIILSKGKSPLTTTIFTLAESSPQFGAAGEVYGGPVHFNRKKGYVASTKNSPSSQPTLTAIPVSNQKVQDLRFVGSARKLRFSSSPKSADIRSPRIQKQIRTINKITSRPSILSGCVYSRSASGLKIFFSLDYARLVRENTKLGFFIQNPVSLQSCLRIEDVRIYREALNPGARKPTLLTGGKMPIAGSSLKLPNTSPKLIASITHGSLKQINFEYLEDNIKAFVGLDRTIIHEDAGTWQYRVEIDIIDETVSAVARLAKLLDRRLSQYNQFLAAADSMGEKGFNIKARIKRDRTRTQAVHKQWKRLINSYVAAVEFIFGASAFAEYSSLEWRKNLIAMANPANGDINAMRSLSNMVREFNTNLKRTYLPTTTAASAGSFNVRSKLSSQSSTKRKNVIRYEFPQVFEQGNLRFTQGIDYLDAQKTNNDGNLTMMTYADYKSRIDQEMNKYKVPRPNDPGVNKFGFMSPKRIMLEGSVVETEKLSIPQSDGNGILEAAQNPGFKGIATDIPPNKSKKVYNQQVTNIMGFAGISAIPNSTPLKKLIVSMASLEEETRFSGDYLSGSNSFVKENLIGNARVSGSLETGLAAAAKKQKMSAFNTSGLAAAIIEGASVDFVKKSKIPPSVSLGDPTAGSLAAECLASTPANFEFNSNFGNAINFGSLVEVQYFDGFVKSEEVLNMAAPHWRRLTEERFKTFQRRGSAVLCRILPLTNNLKIENKYKVDNYDSLFMLHSPKHGFKPVAPEKNYKDTMDSLYKKMSSDMKQVSLNIEDRPAATDVTYTRSSVGVPPVSRKRKTTVKPKPAGKAGMKTSRPLKKGGY